MIKDFENTQIIDVTDIDALRTHFAPRRVVFIDGSFALPGSGINAKEEHRKASIENAPFFDICAIADPSSALPNMLPNHDDFARSVSALGIKNDDILVIYGQDNMLMGPPRVWWMFKGFGHAHVYVLNGGLKSWIRARLPVSSGATNHEETPYTAQSFDGDMVVCMQEVADASTAKSCAIIDARGAARYNGTTPEPREGMRAGHIPHSENLPYSALLQENGTMKPKEELEDILRIHTAHESKRIITTCGSGVTACALMLALHQIGFTNVAVYDGSWSEWGREDSGTDVMQG